MTRARYRIKHKRVSPAFDKVLVQERRWYGWETIAEFYRTLGGLREAKAYIKELEG